MAFIFCNSAFLISFSPVRDGFSPISKEQVLDLPESRVDDLTVVTTFDVNGEVASSPERKTNPKVFTFFYESNRDCNLVGSKFGWHGNPFT